MDVLTQISNLNKNPREPVYFLYGEEDFFHIEFIRNLTRLLITPDNRDFNLETFDAKSSQASHWVGAAKTFSFMGGDKLVVVRNLDETILEEEAVKTLLDYTENPAPETCLVMTARKADRKRKLYKALTKLKGAIACEAPREHGLFPWLKKRAKDSGYDLSQGAARMMVNRIGLRPGLLASELEKVLTFCGNKKTVGEDEVANVVGEIKMENVFDLTDALKGKNAGQAIRLLHNQLEHGEEPVKVLGTIAWQFRLIWEVKFYQSKKLSTGKIAERMGAKPFVVEKAMGYTRNFSDRQLRNSFNNLCWADRQLKTTGKNPEAVLEALVLKLCSTGG